MTEARRTMFVKALGLVGIQATPEVAEIMIEIYEHIKKTGDISIGDIEALQKNVSRLFPKKEVKPEQHTNKPGPRIDKK